MRWAKEVKREREGMWWAKEVKREDVVGKGGLYRVCSRRKG